MQQFSVPYLQSEHPPTVDQTDVSFAATDPTSSEKYTFEWRPQQVSEKLCDKDLSYLWRDGNNDEECAKEGEV